MNELALFAGAGGGILGGHLLGWRTICAVEWEPYPASVLCARQNDKILPPFPVWDDVQTFDGRPWRGLVDVVSGGFPCQDISAAGGGKGIDGKRSGMWRHMARIVGEVLPRFVFVENSPLLVGRGLAVVLGDLAELGYDAHWCRVAASDVGAPHQRDRIWLVAYPHGGNDKCRQGQRPGIHGAEGSQRADYHTCGSNKESAHVADADRSERRQELCPCNGMERERKNSVLQREKGPDWTGARSKALDDPMCRRHGSQESQVCAGRNGFEHASWWPTEPDVGRVANGMAARVDRLKAIGNGQVPRVAATAWEILTQ